MTQLERIKTEINLLKKGSVKTYHNDGSTYNDGVQQTCNRLLTFIESLEKERNVDLENEIGD